MQSALDFRLRGCHGILSGGLSLGDFLYAGGEQLLKFLAALRKAVALGTKLRFVTVSIISYALNSFWVWLLFSHFQLGRAAPILPMLFVTPAVTFVLNRQWVFR